jgi:hypothetical protein
MISTQDNGQRTSLKDFRYGGTQGRFCLWPIHGVDVQIANVRNIIGRGKLQNLPCSNIGNLDPDAFIDTA